MDLQRFRLDGRLAVVTGGARGIGLAMAQAFSQAGATVVLADRDVDAAERSAAEIVAAGGRAAAVGVDVTDHRAVAECAALVEERFGPVDVLAANAGIVRNEPALDTAPESWRAVVDVNLNGVFYTCVEFGRRMVARRRGSVVVTASMSGIIVNTPQAQASYNASKAGAAHLAKSLAVEWAPSGVRVNALAPGYIATELTMRGRSNPEWGSRWVQGTPLGRLGEPDEVAACALFLAADASSFVTGSVLVVDGGYTAL